MAEENTINAGQFPTEDFLLSDYLVKTLEDGTLQKDTVQNLANILETVGEVGFKGKLLTTDTPTEDGWYFAGETGNYTVNAITISVDITNTLTILIIGDVLTTFTNVDIPLGYTVASDGDLLENNPDLFEGGQIFTQISNSIELNNISLTNQIQTNFNSIFNGEDAYSTLDEEYTLELEGDSIQFTVNPLSFTGGLNLIGSSSAGSVIGFYTNGNLYIKNYDDTTWLTTNGLLNTTVLGEELTIKILWGATDISVYLIDSDGIETFQRSIIKDKLYINTVGNAYSSFFNGKVRDIKIVSNGVATNTINPYFLDGNNNIELENTTDGFLTEEQKTTLKNVTSNTEKINNVSSLQTSIPQFIPFSEFNGTTSNISYDISKYLRLDGDYVEIEVRIDDLGASLPTGMGIFGDALKGWNIGFWTNGNLYIREDDGENTQTSNGSNDFITTDGFNAPILIGEVFTLKVLLDVVNAKLITYKDGVLQKEFSYNGIFKIKDIGQGYNTNQTFKGGLKNYKLRADSVYYNFQNLTEIDDATLIDVTLETQTTFLTPEELAKLNSTSLDYSKTYYSLEIDASDSGDEKFTVYEKIKDNYYAGFEINHIIDVSIQSNLWRVVDCWECTFDGVSMTKTSNKLLTGGENEFVYRNKDGGGISNADFTGGIHGDEIQISARFFASGVEITDISSNISLTACNGFYYTNKSNTKSFGTTDNETLHDKLTFIENRGYRTVNRLEWLITPNFDLWYHGISCVSKTCGTVIHNEELDYATFEDADDSFKLSKNKLREYYSSNNLTNLSAFVTSRITNNDTLDLSGGMKVWDRSIVAGGDNKYYRDITSSDVTPISGDVWVSEMIVKFNKL